VILCARRGAEHAAFTSPELRELSKLEHTNVTIKINDIDAARARVGEEPEKDVKSNLDAMSLVAQLDKTSHERTLEFEFLLAPLEIHGTDRVEEIVFSINRIDGDKVVATGETKTIKCGLVISAIGYEAQSISGVPYSKGKVTNVEGYVEGTNIYAVGWAKRGPSGVIGTNKSDASEVIKLLISNLAEVPKNNGDVTDLLTGHTIVTQKHWEKINAAEVALGEPLGKPRLKAVERHDLLRLGGL